MIADRPSEVAARVERLRTVLQQRNRSAAVLRTRRNFAWLSAGGENHVVTATETGVGCLVVTASEVVAITENIEAARIAEEELKGLGIETIPVPWWEPGAVDRVVARRAGRTPASDADLEAYLLPIRSVLSPFDHSRLVELGALARDAVAGTLEWVEEGVTEYEVAADLHSRLVGVRAPVVLVAADDRIPRYRHPLPAGAPVHGRVMVVLVAERWGLHVAVTRFRELEPLRGAIASRFEAIAEIERALHEATRPGATLGEVFAAGQAAYAVAAVPLEWRDHHQGGTIGYRSRETIAAPGDPTRIEAGMAFAWNPSIAGAKAEDTFILEEDGSRRFVTAHNASS